MNDRLSVVASAAAPPPAGAYAQAVIAPPFVVTAGQVGVHPETGRAPAGVTAQVDRALRNVEAVLAGAGLGLGDVVKTTCFLADMGDFAEFDRAYRERFGDRYPARTTVGAVLAAGLLVEVEAWALLRGEGDERG